MRLSCLELGWLLVAAGFLGCHAGRSYPWPADGIGQVRAVLPLLKDTPPLPARDGRDSLLQAVLETAATVRGAVPDFGLLPDSHRIVIGDRDGSLSPHAIPALQAASFILLDRDSLQALANEYGHFVYLSVPYLEVTGELARVTIATQWIFDQTEPIPMIALSGGACDWYFRRHDARWVAVHQGGCIVS